MDNKLFVETIDDTTVSLTGCIGLLTSNRRANRLLRDSFNCEFSESTITILQVSDFHHCFLCVLIFHCLIPPNFLFVFVPVGLQSQ